MSKKPPMICGMEIPLSTGTEILSRKERERGVKLGHPQIRLFVTNELVDHSPLIQERGKTNPRHYPHVNTFMVFYVMELSSCKLPSYFDKRLDVLPEVAQARKTYAQAKQAFEAAQEENENFLKTTIPEYVRVLDMKSYIENRMRSTRNSVRHLNRRVQKILDADNEELRKINSDRERIRTGASLPHSEEVLSAVRQTMHKARNTYQALKTEKDTREHREKWLNEYINTRQVMLGNIPPDLHQLIRQERVPLYQLEPKPQELSVDNFGLPRLPYENERDRLIRLMFPIDLLLKAMEPVNRNTVYGRDDIFAYVPLKEGQRLEDDPIRGAHDVLLGGLHEGKEWLLILGRDVRKEIIKNLDALRPGLIDWLVGTWTPSEEEPLVTAEVEASPEPAPSPEQQPEGSSSEQAAPPEPPATPDPTTSSEAASDTTTEGASAPPADPANLH